MISDANRTRPMAMTTCQVPILHVEHVAQEISRVIEWSTRDIGQKLAETEHD